MSAIFDLLCSKRLSKLPLLILSRKARSWKIILVENVETSLTPERMEGRICIFVYFNTSLCSHQESNQLVNWLSLCEQRKIEEAYQRLFNLKTKEVRDTTCWRRASFESACSTSMTQCTRKTNDNSFADLVFSSDKA